MPQTFKSGSRRFSWSQSTETTGSFVDEDCMVSDATADDMLGEIEPGVLYNKWEETEHELNCSFCHQRRSTNSSEYKINTINIWSHALFQLKKPKASKLDFSGATLCISITIPFVYTSTTNLHQIQASIAKCFFTLNQTWESKLRSNDIFYHCNNMCLTLENFQTERSDK